MLCFAIIERRDKGLYVVPLSMSLLGFGNGDYVSQLPYVWYYVGVKSIFNMLVKNASSRGSMCCRCLMFRLSGPCELLFLLCFIAFEPELWSV